MAHFYPVNFYRWPGKKGHCPIFTRIVPVFTQITGVKMGHLKMNITNKMHLEIIGLR